MALFPKKPFALTKKVQLQVDGVPPSGLEDSFGRLIDGDHNGQAGSNAVVILSSGGVSLTALALGSTGVLKQCERRQGRRVAGVGCVSRCDTVPHLKRDHR